MKIGTIRDGKIAKGFLIDTDLINLESEFVLDNFTKLAIITIIAGYKKCDHIYVNDRFTKKLNLRNLDYFISYILNHPIAPKKFNIKISYNKKFVEEEKNNILNFNKINFDSILSFSGGLDSTAGLLYTLEKKQKVLPIWIDYGQKNRMAEYKAVHKITKKIGIKMIVIKLDLNSFISEGSKDWNFIIPGRNFLFLSIANSLLKLSNKKAGKIYLCAHKDEMKHKVNKDKSRYFFSTAARFFSLESSRKIKTLSPLSNFSKAEIIYYWKKNWEKKFGISPHDTTSCYYKSSCGRCGACLHRAILLLATGYKIDSKMEVNPMEDPGKLIINDWMPRIKSKDISGNKKLDFLIAVSKCINIVPRAIRKYYEQLPKKTINSLEKRKKEIESVKLV